MKLQFLSLLSLVSLASTATFSNPLNRQNGADPCMRFIGGKYYLTNTKGANIQMSSATTIEGLKAASSQVLFSDDTAGRNTGMWAPEFWFLSGRWYIYYAADGNNNDRHRLHVLVGSTDANNPTGSYTYAAALLPSNFDKWSVDGDILSVNGKNYLIWSGRPNDPDLTQCIMIAPMSSPTELGGPAVQISCPQFAWEKNGFGVMEGPESITIGSTTHIVYSASYCGTDDYALGKLTLASGADPLKPESWSKASSPVFSKNPSASVYAPGHHFMFEKNGSHYFAYHANPASGQGCGANRTTRVQPFSTDGSSPIFPAAIATGVPITEP